MTKRLLAATALAALVAACASIPLKQRAVSVVQASETTLEAAHDLERSLCFVAPATERGNHCTNQAAATVHLTDAAHVALASAFEVAFTAQDKAFTALEAWHSGDPAPASVKDYQADLTAILALVKQLAPGAGSLVGKVQSAVDEGASILSIVGVK